jgi:ferredoxin--NADP+ reductase
LAAFKVIENRQLTAETFVLRTERPNVPILAGQCFSVGTEELAINREYSMYSAANDDYVDFLIRQVKDGRVSTALQVRQPASMVEIGGPYGQFCLDENKIKTHKFLFVASGTGIAPFHSFVKTYPNLDYHIFHGIRRPDEKYDQADYESNRYFSAVSQPEDGTNRVRVTDLLNDHVLAANEIVYLCGNRSMITDCVEILRNKGIKGDSLFMETFF